MDTLARWISRLAHPFVLPVPGLVIALVQSGISLAVAIGWAALCVAVVILPATALLIRQRRADGDWYVTVREQRRGLYALGGACLVALLALLVWLDAPRLLLAALAGAIVAHTIGALLNRVLKPSVHAGAAAGTAVLLAHATPSLAALLAAAVALVAWARWQLAHHTLVELALGAGISAGAISLALRCLA